MKLIIDQHIPFVRGVFEPFGEVVYLPPDKIDAQAVRDADGLMIRTRTRCDASLIEGSRVRMIATATIGFDHIDTVYCRQKGIQVATAAGCNARGVAQWAFAALGAMGYSPQSGTLGILGVGNVGSVVREVAEGAGFSVLCCDPPRQNRKEPGTETFVSREELLRRSDIVTVHVALDETTRQMADGEFFNRMKPGAGFLNSSRGEIVDEKALKEAIRNNHLSETALDVWHSEPEIDRELLGMVSVATPHIAGYTLQGKAMGTALSVRATAGFFGLPVDRQWYPPEASVQHPRNDLSWKEIFRNMENTYDIRTDDKALRGRPEDFEKLRSGYRFRSEFF